MPDQQADWQRLQIPKFDGGLNLEVRPEDIDPSQSPDLLNLDYVQGKLQADTGYGTFGQAVLGIPQGAFQIFLTNGSNEFILATTGSFYTWNSVNTEWDFVSDQHQTTTTASAVSGATSISVASATGWSVNDWLGIPLDNGTQLKTQITSIGASVGINPAVPASRSVANGATVNHAPILSGSLDFQVEFLTFPANNWLIFTNGVDNLKYYIGGILQDVTGLPTNTSCRAISVFHEMLFIGDTTENGTRFPQRIRRSDAGDPTNWDTGISGIDNLLDTEDFILSLNLLGPWIIIYRETTVMRGSFLGNPGQIMFYEYMLEGEGAISSGGIAETGGSHIVIGNQGIYQYVGGYDLTEIGNSIYYKTLAITGDLNPTKKDCVFAFYVGELDEVWMFYPSTNSNVPDTMLRVVLENNAWFVRKFFNSMSGFGFYLSALSRTWSSLVGSWAAQTWTWDSKVTLANAPITLLCDSVNSQVYNYDYITQNDNGNAINWYFVTKDFGMRDFFIRLNAIILNGRGNNVLVEISLDQGNSYSIMGAVNFGTSFSRQKLYKQTVSEFIRFRFSGTDPAFAISWMEIEWDQESNW